MENGLPDLQLAAESVSDGQHVEIVGDQFVETMDEAFDPSSNDLAPVGRHYYHQLPPIERPVGVRLVPGDFTLALVPFGCGITVLVTGVPGPPT